MIYFYQYDIVLVGLAYDIGAVFVLYYTYISSLMYLKIIHVEKANIIVNFF